MGTSNWVARAVSETASRKMKGVARGEGLDFSQRRKTCQITPMPKSMKNTCVAGKFLPKTHHHPARATLSGVLSETICRGKEKSENRFSYRKVAGRERMETESQKNGVRQSSNAPAT